MCNYRVSELVVLEKIDLSDEEKAGDENDGLDVEGHATKIWL